MSLKNSITTADYLPWGDMANLVRKLYQNGNERLSLLVLCGCFTGLRISDLLRLQWQDVLTNDKFLIIERKTGKRREIGVNRQLKAHALDCYKSLGEPKMSEPMFMSKKRTVYTVQRINIMLKECKEKYGLDIEHFSTHSFRKTFGRNLINLSRGNEEMALVKLSEIFGHSSTAITRRYLGLKQQEILECYSLFEF